MHQQHILLLSVGVAAACLLGLVAATDPTCCSLSRCSVPNNASNPNPGYVPKPAFDVNCIPVAIQYKCLKQNYLVPLAFGKPDKRYYTWTNVVQKNSVNLMLDIINFDLTSYAGWENQAPFLTQCTNLPTFLIAFSNDDMYSPLPYVFANGTMLLLVPPYWERIQVSAREAGFSLYDLAAQACAPSSSTSYSGSSICCGCWGQPNRTVTLTPSDGPQLGNPYYDGCLLDQCQCGGNSNGKVIGAAHVIFTFYSCMNTACHNNARNYLGNTPNMCSDDVNTVNPNCQNCPPSA